MWHVDRLCFPAALAMTAMGHWADEVLTRAEKDAWLDFFHAAQTGDLPALQPMVRRLPARKWRHVCSAGAAHVASVRLKRAVAVAAANGRTECVRLLLGADAALVAESAGRLRPAFLAIKSDSVQCLELLLAAKASTGGRGKSPPLLLAAVMHGASACIVATLLAARAPVYARHVLTDPLAEAAKCQTPEVVQLLLGAKACVHGRDTPFGWHGIHGPIRAAAANVTDHRLAVLQLLLDAKASVNADAGDGTGQGQAEGQGQGPGQGTYFPLDFAATADAAALLRAHGARTARLARPAHSTRPARDSK
jgi:hypothetical protein